MRILLISNSTIHGRGYLDHAENEIRDFLGAAKNILFFPFALHDRDGYAGKANERFAAMGYEMTSAHKATDPEEAVANTDAIFIGGGNTFRLVKALQDLGFIDPIRRRVRKGARPTSEAVPARTWPARQSRPRRTCQSFSRAPSIR